MKYNIAFCLLLFSLLMIVRAILYYRKSNKEKNELLNELYELNDRETLYKIGEMNSFGEKEWRRVPPFLYSDWLDEKYKITKNEIYNDIDMLMIERNEKIITFGLSIVLPLMIAFILISI